MSQNVGDELGHCDAHHTSETFLWGRDFPEKVSRVYEKLLLASDLGEHHGCAKDSQDEGHHNRHGPQLHEIKF